MRWFIRFLVVFVFIAAGSTAAMSLFDIDFGTADYWDAHGLGLLIGLSLFPRLTLLFSSIATGGLLWWLGWLFVPRILVAILATVTYFHANPVLVVFAWLCAVGGETTEKHYARQRAGTRGRNAAALGVDESKVIDV